MDLGDYLKLSLGAAVVVGGIYLYKKLTKGSDSATVTVIEWAAETTAEAATTASDRISDISDNPWKIIWYGSIPGQVVEVGKKLGWW